MTGRFDDTGSLTFMELEEAEKALAHEGQVPVGALAEWIKAQREGDGMNEEQPFVGEGPWLTIVNPAEFMTYCSGCGDSLKKGGKTRRAAGGWGYLCEDCGRDRPTV